MPHPHEVVKIYTDEETKGTCAKHQLPIPMGWKILIQPNQIKQQTKGGIILPSKAKENEAYLNAHGEVAGIGELAYGEGSTEASWSINNKPKISDRVTDGK